MMYRSSHADGSFRKYFKPIYMHVVDEKIRLIFASYTNDHKIKSLHVPR